MDSWNEVVSLSNNGKVLWGLNPSLSEVIGKDTLSVTISDTSAKHMDFEHWLGLWGGQSECLQVLMKDEPFMWNSEVAICLLEEKNLWRFGLILVSFGFFWDLFAFFRLIVLLFLGLSTFFSFNCLWLLSLDLKLWRCVNPCHH